MAMQCKTTVAITSHLHFVFNDTATTEIYTLSLHDALPICPLNNPNQLQHVSGMVERLPDHAAVLTGGRQVGERGYFYEPDRKSTRLNSSHANISYAVFCLKKKNTHQHPNHAKTSYLVLSLK